MHRPCHTHAATATDERHATPAPHAHMLVIRTMMFADTLLVVCCTLFIVSATTDDVYRPDARVQKYRAIVDENVNVDAQRYYTTTDSSRSCCSGSTTMVADIRDPREIPLNVIMELNQVKNVTDLFTKFMPNVDLHDAQKLVATTGFQSRSALNMERKAALIPKPAGCSIESQTISLKDSDDPSLYYYPPCTRVNRCGGCCAHDLLACQPTKLETLNFEVMVSQYNGEGKLEFKGRKAVSIVQHSKCKCDCIVKEEDCSPLQSYYSDECRCMCNNEEDREKCNEEYNIKLWNPSMCTCQCRETQECTEGFAFDYNSCRCEVLRIKNKNIVLNKNRYALDGQ